ncbi:hypothetical protein [Paenibacillus sp. GP183]|uniref:hypothetical protein n=1 Tax=Paenibacillus sp. GP183 TaxID=1882751 RepID=UPI0008944080|nr:hypothetical protein [Paenibacillus sp. GP183]SEB56215.1 hypothetical protein SAMN05443246_1083 [Paenibacillus sp. GP183]
MKIKVVLFLLVIIVFFFPSLKLQGTSNPIISRTPTEQELVNFQDIHGKALAIKYYNDHAIVLGDNSGYSLSITNDNKPQYIGSSWGGAPERVDVIAVTQETSFIGVIVHRKDVLEQGRKMKIKFEDGSIVEITMNHEKAFIVDHPTGKLTNSSKAKVEVFNNNNEMIYQNF